MSARSDLFEIEDYFLDHMQTEKKPNCAPASPTSKDVSDSVILLKISQSEPCYHCCVTVTKNIVSQSHHKLNNGDRAPDSIYVLCGHPSQPLNILPLT